MIDIPAGTPVIPYGIICWLGPERYNSGTVWFSDIALYVNGTNIIETMCDSVKALLNDAPFDGYNECYSGWTGDLSDLESYYHNVATAVKSVNRIPVVTTHVDSDGYTVEDYANLVPDFYYNIPLFNGKVVSYDSTTWNRILSYSPCPVIMGISVWDEVFDTDSWNYLITLDQQLAWYNSLTQPNGYAIHHYDQMTYGEMTSFGTFST